MSNYTFQLGSESYTSDQFAVLAANLPVDWSAVFGGTVRLGGNEWEPGTPGKRTFDMGGDWLLIVPVESIPGPMQPVDAGFRGPVGSDRIALAAWLLLASLPCGGLPDILLVPEQIGAQISKPLDPRKEMLWGWPRTYRFATGFFDPPASISNGNNAFVEACGLDEHDDLPWLAPLHLPCATAALGRASGTSETLLTWENIADAAFRLAATAYNLAGAMWPRGESVAIPIWEISELTPTHEQEDYGLSIGLARRHLPPWMADSQVVSGDPQQVSNLKDWNP